MNTFFINMQFFLYLQVILKRAIKFRLAKNTNIHGKAIYLSCKELFNSGITSLWPLIAYAIVTRLSLKSVTIVLKLHSSTLHVKMQYFEFLPVRDPLMVLLFYMGICFVLLDGKVKKRRKYENTVIKAQE